MISVHQMKLTLLELSDVILFLFLSLESLQVSCLPFKEHRIFILMLILMYLFFFSYVVYLKSSWLQLGLPWWLSGKASTYQCKRRRFDSWVWKIPWRRKWQPIPVFLPGKSHGQRSLVDYSPWGHKELDIIEHTHMTTIAYSPCF